MAASSVRTRRVALVLLATFGALALVLAAAGIYGLMAHLVAVRTAEIGIRMALGARPWDLMRLVLQEGFLQALCGLCLGIGGGVALMRVFRGMLYEISPADPVTLAAVALLLLSAALGACLVPARRARRVDPVIALPDS